MLKIECVMEELCILVIIVLEFRAGHWVMADSAAAVPLCQSYISKYLFHEE